MVGESRKKLAEDLSYDANVAKIVEFVGEDVATILIEKYGEHAFSLYTKVCEAPANVVSITDGKFRNSRECLLYIAQNDIPDDKIASLLGVSVEDITNGRKSSLFDKRVDANETYKLIAGDVASVSIEQLLRAGVTQEDFQIVFEKDNELAFNIGESPSNNRIIEKSKYKNNGRAMGKCGTGTKAVIDSIPGNPTAKALRLSTPKSATEEGMAAGGGSGYYARLESSGQYVVLDMPNKAYVDTTEIPDNQKYKYILNNRRTEDNKNNIEEMLEFTNQLPKGVILTWDNHVVNLYGKKKPLDVKSGATGQGIEFGHVCMKTTSPKDDKQEYKCDGKQTNPHHVGWYGENIHMCYNIDCQVPKEYAKMIIAQAQERLGYELDAEIIKQNQATYDKKYKKSKTSSRRGGKSR